MNEGLTYMASELKRDTVVASPDTGELEVLPAGTRFSDLAQGVKDQLAPEHFTGTLSDWRPQEQQDADAEFFAARDAELAARQAAKNASLAEAKRAEAQRLLDEAQELEG